MKWPEFYKTCKEYFSKPGSTWYQRNIDAPGALIVAFIAHRLGMSPNALTVFSNLCAVAAMAAILWRPDDWRFGLLNLFLLQLCFIADCADGVLARLQNKSSRFGAFLDNVLDTFNYYIVFIGFGIAWALKSPDEIHFENVILYITGAALYTCYYHTSLIRGYLFGDLKGTMVRYGQNWKEKILKIPYELINRGIHYLLLSIAYIFDAIYWMVLFYGILGGSLTMAMVFYVYFKDSKNKSM